MELELSSRIPQGLARIVEEAQETIGVKDSIYYLKKVTENLRDRTDQERALKKILWIHPDPIGRADAPLPQSWTRSKSARKTLYKAKVGDLRIIYELRNGQIEIRALGYRKEVYRKICGHKVSEK